FDGYAIGGLGVGEPKDLLWEMCAVCTEHLSKKKPRYLMGLGTPEDLLEGIASGVDLFDCVLPTRNGRNGQAFTSYGTLNLRNAACGKEEGPIEIHCPCSACCRYSRAYLHHLLKANEMLGPILITLHNITFYLRLMAFSREAIREGCFQAFKEETLQRLRREV
ncbi:MAG: tRNA guanosine(34) transglycosylase Tgt, partial [Candidatus Omnitrophota bacterium]